MMTTNFGSTRILLREGATPMMSARRADRIRPPHQQAAHDPQRDDGPLALAPLDENEDATPGRR